MRVKEILDYAFMQTGQGRIDEIPNDSRSHALTSLNVAYKKVWQIFPWQRQKEIELDVTSVLGVVTLPYHIGEVTAVRIGNLDIDPIHENRFNRVDPNGLSREGSVYGYIWGEPSPVLTQPASALAARIKSSSASDTTGTVRIYGTVGGNETYEDFTLNGTSNVDGSSAFTSIRKISKPTTVSRITVSDQSDNEWGTIAPEHTQPEYQQLILVNTPTANETITITGLRRFVPLVADEDVIEPEALETAVQHLLMSIMYLRTGNIPMSQNEERLATDALKFAANRENEIADKDFRITPSMGDFGDMGDADRSYGSEYPHYVTR